MKKLLEFDYMHTNKTYICIFCIWNLFDLSVFFFKRKASIFNIRLVSYSASLPSSRTKPINIIQRQKQSK